ncbi:MAG: sugar ABC transporter ATP-binding protein [Geminicoccaceae bacterium]
MTTPLLQMTGIDKAFAGVAALTSASLTIEPGEIHAVIGQNGAGKSTLIKILTGVYRRDAGLIMFAGKPSTISSPREAQDSGISTIYQELTLVPLRSVTENVTLGYEPRIWGGIIDWPRAHARTREILARFGIEIDVRAPLGSYSTAIQQLVAIARAVSLDARLVIMDEPTSSLDDREVEVLFGVVRGLKASGVSVLYVSHFLDELFRICDLVTVMRDGRTVARKAIAETTKLELIADMLGRDIDEIRADGMTELGGGQRDRSGEVLPRRRRPPPTGASTGSTSSSTGARSWASPGSWAPAAPRRPAPSLASTGCRRAASASKARPLGPGFRHRRRHRLPHRGPQGRGHRARDVGARERDAGGAAEAQPGRADRARPERALVEAFIKSLGIKTANMDQPIRELSGGNQQKALLARWLATEPELLILDEPTRGVDVGAKLEIQAIIRDYVARGFGVLLISSEFEELVEGADRITVMQDGYSVTELQNPGITENALVKAIAHHHRGQAPA